MEANPPLTYSSTPGSLQNLSPVSAIENHAAVPLSWELDPDGRSHYERGAVQGKSIKLDVGIVRNAQGTVDDHRF